MADVMVHFEKVSKLFRLGESQDSLRDLLAAGIRRVLGRGRAPMREEFWALSGVDFHVERGASVGVIGPNGAGKSTVLKLLSHVLRPDRGRILVRGRLAALIEVGAGFHGDLTGPGEHLSQRCDSRHESARDSSQARRDRGVCRT